MKLTTARIILALLWGVGSVFVIGVVFLTTVSRHATHDDRVQLWNWTLSWLIPPLTAIVLTFRAKAHRRRLTRRVDRFFVGLVFLMSAAELTGIVIILVLELWVPSFDVVSFAADSKEWAKSIQAVLALGMGGFFFMPRDRDCKGPPNASGLDH